MDKFPAYFDQNIGMNFGKDAYLFLRSKRELSSILVGLISDSRLYQQDFPPYYIIYPYMILFYTLHTRLYLSHNLLFSVKGVKVHPLLSSSFSRFTKGLINTLFFIP